MIPPVVLNAAQARLEHIDRCIGALRDEAREITAWLDRAEGRTQEQLPMPTAPKPHTATRTTRAPMAKVGKDVRPTRHRDGTETTEYFFPRGSYSTISDRLSIGTHEAAGVWLTLDEWTRCKGENAKAKKAGAYAQ